MNQPPAFVIVEAPSVLGLFPGGVEKLPQALLHAGLAQSLDAEVVTRVEPPAFDPRRDPVSGLLNPHAIAAYSRALGAALQPLLERGRFPIVLGGDCSILLGCLLPLRQRGRSGLLFLDGHADFYQPEAEPKGEAASMDLALATGRGPAVVTDIDGLIPLVRDGDVVVLGRRDAEDAQAHGSQRIEDTTIQVIDLHDVRRRGAGACAADALVRLSDPTLDGFWIHLDADVIDDALMPAVDYRMPDGLSWDELASVLAAAVGSGHALGIDIAIFNPTLDPDGSIARAFVAALVRGLRGA